MGKSYRLVRVKYIDGLLAYEQYWDYAVAILHWLAKELFDELHNELPDVEIQIVHYVHMSISEYPVLAVHFPDIERNDTAIEDRVAVVANRLLQERPISELVQFISANEIDWKEVTKKIME